MIQVTFLKDHSGIGGGEATGHVIDPVGDKVGRTETNPETVTIVQASDDRSLGRGGSHRNYEKWFDSEYILKIVLENVLMDWMREVREAEHSDLPHH